jgi:type I restriction enzyme S subunit
MGRYQAYPEYKDSGVEWVGEIPEHWYLTKIRYITDCLDGKRIPLNATERGEMQGEIPYWGANSVVDFVNDWLFDEVLVLVGEDGAPFFDKTKSVAFHISGKVWPNNHVHVLRPKATIVNSKFLTYSLNMVDYHLYITGSTRDKLNQSDLNNIVIRYCSVQEQAAIANFLDHETAKIDTLIEQQQQLIQLLKEKRQAVISHAVTKGLNPDAPMKDSGVEWLGEVPAHWVISTVKNFCFINDGNHGEEYPTDSDFVAAEEGVPFIRASDFDEWQIVETDLKYISKEKNSSMRKGRLQDGDILFVNRGSTIGKLCLIDSAYAGSNLNSQIAYLRTNKDQMHYGYLAFFLSSSYIQTRIFSEIQGGALPQYPLKHIARLIVCQPPLAEQIDIFKTLSKQIKIFRESIQNAEAANALLQERRTALISAAVTGKIDVRNWQAPTN